MKRKEIKYNYATYKILSHIVKDTNLIVVHNKETNKMYLYNLITKNMHSTDYNLLIDEIFKNEEYKNLPLTIKEYVKFITALPENYKEQFKNGLKGELNKCLDEKQNSKKKKLKK